MRWGYSSQSFIHRALRQAAGPIATLAVLGVIEALRMRGMPALLLLAVACSALTGGLRPGVLSGVIALAYALYHYRAPGAGLHYAPADSERLVAFGLALPLVIVTLAHLERRLRSLLLDERRLREQAESERRRIASILESITDGFFALDSEWRYTYVNNQAEYLVGRTRQELLGKPMWEAFPPLVGSTWDREYRRAVEQQVAVHFDEYYPPLDTWFETHAYPSAEGLAIYMRSINERKHAEAQLRARARQQAAVATLGQQALRGEDLTALMDAAVSMLASTLGVELTKILELDADGRELVVRAGVGWTGGCGQRVPAGECSQAGYTLKSSEPVVVRDLAAEARFAGPRLLLDDGVVSGMSVIIAGKSRPFGILGAHSRQRREFTEDDVNFVQSVANVLAEAIERKRNEQVLAESELRFRQLAENVHEIFYVREADPVRLLYVSPAYETVWGRSCSSLYEQPSSWLEAIHPHDHARVSRSIAERDGDFCELEYRVMRPDGAVRWIRDRSSLVYDDQGRADRVVGIAEDVTDQRAAAEAASRLAASEASLRTRDEVLAVVAHDLRNPLNNIALTAGMLAEPDLSASEHALCANKIARAVERAERLINDLLDAARLESGQFTIRPQALDVTWLMSEAREGFSPIAAQRSVALECSVAEDVPRAFGDPDRILQALGNLLVNALEFTPRGGRICLSAELSEEGVDFAVRDTGGGIAADALPHVFDRFYRARASNQKGLGLGLSIVRGIATAHRGRVWAQSEAGKGSVFHFAIPAERARP